MALHLTVLTESGIAVQSNCVIYGFLLGMDGVNDPTITIYSNTTNSGLEVVPTNTFDASALGVNGVILPSSGIRCSKGIYVEITCSGSCEVTIFYAGSQS